MQIKSTQSATYGAVFELPDAVAQKLIAQGRAVAFDGEPTKKRERATRTAPETR